MACTIETALSSSLHAVGGNGINEPSVRFVLRSQCPPYYILVMEENVYILNHFFILVIN